jgi:hypothetical protein
MRTRLALAILAALLGGCAIVPIGYDDGYYRHHDRYYRDRGYDHYDRWSGRYWRDDARYYSNGAYYRGWDRGQ